jgi:TIR domain
MGFLKNFEYDLFVSYSHVDNLTSDPEQKGWVDKFHDELRLKLWQRIGDITKLNIFWDSRKIDPSQEFERTLHAALDRTAVFIALTSNGYLRENGWCLRELRRFSQTAQADRWGMAIGDRRRLFNLLLNKIPVAAFP